jgi:hypothetical protein
MPRLATLISWRKLTAEGLPKFHVIRRQMGELRVGDEVPASYFTSPRRMRLSYEQRRIEPVGIETRLLSHRERRMLNLPLATEAPLLTKELRPRQAPTSAADLVTKVPQVAAVAKPIPALRKKAAASATTVLTQVPATVVPLATEPQPASAKRGWKNRR